MGGTRLLRLQDQLKYSLKEVITLNGHSSSNVTDQLINTSASKGVAYLVVSENGSVLYSSPQCEQKYHLIEGDQVDWISLEGHSPGGLLKNGSSLDDKTSVIISTIFDLVWHGEKAKMVLLDTKQFQNKVFKDISEIRDLKERAGIMPGIAFRCKSDNQWQMIALSDHTLELTGYSVEELISTEKANFRKLILSEDRYLVEKTIKKAIKQRIPYQLLYRIQHANGEIKWVQEQGQGIISEDDKINVLEGWIIDVTDRKKVEDALCESESRYRSLVEASPDAVIMLDKAGYIALGNNHFCKLLEISDPNEILGKNILDFIDTNTRSLVNRDFQTLISSLSVTAKVFRLQAKNGTTVPVETNMSTIYGADGEPKAYIVVGRDIRQRDQAELALRMSEARYRAIVEDNPEMIVRYFQDGVITFANAAFCRYIGLSLDELVGYKITEKINGKGHRVIEKFMSQVSPDMPVIIQEFSTHVSKDIFRWYRWKTNAIKDDADLFLEYQSIGEDITDEKKAQQAERESENRLRELMENIKLIAIILDPNGQVTFCNSFFNELTGWKKEDVIGQKWVDRFIPAELTGVLQHVLIDSALIGDMPVRYENPILTNTGEQRLISWINTLLRDSLGGIVGIASVGEDITEKHLYEKIQNAILKISLSVNQTNDLNSLYKSIHEVLKTIVSVDNFFIALYDDEKNLISFPYFVDQYDDAPEPKTPRRGMTEYVFRTGKTLLANPEKFEQLVAANEIESLGTPSLDWIGVPLKIENRLIGVMVAQTYSPGIRYKDRDEQILTFVSTQVAMAIERKRSEQALLTSQKRNELLIAASTDAIFMELLDGTILDCNDVAQRMYGYTRDELIDKNVADLIPQEVSREIDDYIKWELEQGGFVQEVSNMRKDGSIFPVEVSIRQTIIDDTQVLVVYVRDITEQKQAARVILESKEKFRTLAETTAAGIYIHQEKNYLYVNPKWCQITGYSEVELLQMGPTDILNRQDALEAQQNIHRRLKGEVVQDKFEHIIHTHSGEKRVIDLNVNLIEFEGEKSIIGTAVDITNRKQREHELEIIAEMSEALRANIARDEILSTTIDKLIDLMNVEGAFLSLVNTDNSGILLKKTSGIWRSLENSTVKIEQSLSGHIITTNQTYLNNQPEIDPYVAFPEAVKGLASIAGVPLITHGETIGSLVIGAHHQFSENDLRLLKAIAGFAASAIHRADLFEQTRQQADELKQAYDSTLEGWALALELRDKETQGHSVRIAKLTLKLAKRLGIPAEEMENIRRGALLHDIGKLGVPDTVLLKQGKLNAEEWEVMQKHPLYAYDMLSAIRDFKDAIDIPYCHHEWWDGSGYPRGLEGKSIPLPARIFCIVDVWDALTSNRPYRGAWTKKEALAHIINQAGTHFDPDVVNEFIQMVVEEK